MRAPRRMLRSSAAAFGLEDRLRLPTAKASVFLYVSGSLRPCVLPSKRFHPAVMHGLPRIEPTSVGTCDMPDPGRISRYEPKSSFVPMRELALSRHHAAKAFCGAS